jgi:ADP-heptose:LPS heptosyltransferase
VKSFDLDALGDAPNIVVVVRDHMSGVLYSVPHARAIRRRFPNSSITLLTSSYSAPVLGGGGMYYDQVLPLFSFSDEPKRFDRAKDLLAKGRTWFKLVGRVDLVIHLRVVGGSTVAFCALLGNPPQVGNPQPGRFNKLVKYPTGAPDRRLGSRQRNTLILEELGIPVESEEMEIEISPDDLRWAEHWLERIGHVAGEPIIVVHPGCHWGCNQWLIDRWRATAAELLRVHGGSIVVTGSNRERPMAQEIVDGLPGRCFNSAGETTLGQLAALISMSYLVVAIDTAPTQICQALKTPAVIMMGDGTMSWNGPIEGEPMVMLRELDPNRPDEICRWSDGACNGPQCTSRLVGIDMNTVLESAVRVLSATE